MRNENKYGKFKEFIQASTGVGSTKKTERGEYGYMGHMGHIKHMKHIVREDDMYWCNYCKDYHDGVDHCGMRKQLDLGVFCSACGSIVAEPGENGD